MKTLSAFCCAAIAAATMSAEAGRLDRVTVWRGETYAHRLKDGAFLGESPAGIALRYGIAESVRYLDRPGGTHYSEVADRVVWGSEAVGPQIVSVTASPDMKPGTYRCGDLEVTVLDRVMPPPSQWKFSLNLWQHPWAVARWNSVKPFTPEHYAAMRPLWELLASAGQKSLTVTILDLPWNHQCYDGYYSMVRHIRRADGTWRFDYSILDEYVAFGRSCGLGPEISCFTMCPWEYGVNWETEDGKAESAKLLPGTPEFADYWGEFLADFHRHAKEKGWIGDVYITMDERGPDDVRNIANLVREKAPGFKIALAGNKAPSVFEGIDINTYCSGFRHITDKLVAEASDRRAKGMCTTFYVCCGPDYPNTFCSSETEESFCLGAYPAISGLDGLWRWAWNSWPRNPMVDASYMNSIHGWKAGDTFLVYPDGSPSYRFLELRNGIVATEKVRLLRERGELDESKLTAVAKLFDRNKAMKNEVNFQGIRRRMMDIVNAEAKAKGK